MFVRLPSQRFPFVATPRASCSQLEPHPVAHRGPISLQMRLARRISWVLALCTLYTTSAALLPQTGVLRGSHRVSRTGGGVRACDSEETRDSEEIPLHRADGSRVDDLRQDFRSKLSEMFEREQMQREEERANAPPSRAPSAGGAPLDSDYVWQVARSRHRPTDQPIGKQMRRPSSSPSPNSNPCP